ncbi:MAG: hypothetical protein K8U57_35460 [Planctomycetes bacterium]|nr:hypothetical protein [Planctomycetota bacterium]
MRWGLIGAGVALLLLGPVGLYVVLTYAYQGEPPWVGPLFYASIGAPILGLALVVAGLMVRRRG